MKKDIKEDDVSKKQSFILKEMYNDFFYKNKENLNLRNVDEYIDTSNHISYSTTYYTFYIKRSFSYSNDSFIFRNLIKYLLPEIDIFEYLNIKDMCLGGEVSQHWFEINLHILFKYLEKQQCKYLLRYNIL